MRSKLQLSDLLSPEWFGSIAGILGALLLAANIQYSGYGWLLFLVSNIAWIVYALQSKIKSMLIMQLVFTSTSLIGIFRWIM